MRLWTLGSGSQGNAALVECDGARILIDAGFGIRELAKRLKIIHVDPKSIEACFVTHEHTDHVKGAGSGARRFAWTVHASRGTAQARELARTHVARFNPGSVIELTRMIVETVRTPHDAAESTGFVITSKATGARAALFYDIGHVSEAITTACRHADILVIESNHDEEMLRNGPYPRWLQARIASDTGHLSNRHSALLAREVVTSDVNHVVLAHLSQHNNLPHVALKSMRAGLAKTRFRGTITVAKQDAVSGPFAPGAAKADAPVQFALAL